MSVSQKYYVLTETAVHDFRQARSWSNKRWGKALTKQYFIDLHEGAEYIARYNQNFPSRADLSGELYIGVYPVREHHMVYVPVKKDFVVIVALMRQTRDIPAILKANYYQIKRELKEIKHLLED